MSFVSRVAAQRGLDLGRIKAVAVAGMSIQREIVMARNRLRACTCARLRFREFLQSAEGQQVIASVTG